MGIESELFPRETTFFTQNLVKIYYLKHICFLLIFARQRQVVKTRGGASWTLMIYLNEFLEKGGVRYMKEQNREAIKLLKLVLLCLLLCLLALLTK